MFIQTEATPNPDVMKFLPGREVLGTGSREIASPEEAIVSPLATSLFALGDVTRVFLGPDFLTVTRNDEIEWAHLKAPILAAIMDHYTSGKPVLVSGGAAAEEDTDDTVYDEDTLQIVAEIKDLLDTRVRPAVAQDGGDIVFGRFDVESGTVYLHMRGACSGCPSSAATLKAGVENMLRHYVPEVMRVEQTL
ncbi:MAG: NifU family protein [Caulobacter sp.]|nr:NifU family protein [Caulobacter sp.]